MNNIWKSGIMGVVVGDALGCPVQFENRATVATHPVTGMRGHGVFDMPVGTWTDDSALTLATMDSIGRCGKVLCTDIMKNFVDWLDAGKFTPFGFAFDIGRGTMTSINAYKATHNAFACGGREMSNNGNGSLMRIMPVVLYCISRNVPLDEAIETIHAASALTHAHSIAKVACGLYYFMAESIRLMDGSLLERLQIGMNVGWAYYELRGYDKALHYFRRLRDLHKWSKTSVQDVRTSGYVVDSLEAAVWGLVTTNAFDEALLTLVNLGGDTDSIAAIAGGLAGLYYGYDQIPKEWVDVIQRKDYILRLIKEVE
jgi:ADP-ribosylglycohydrolase